MEIGTGSMTSTINLNTPVINQILETPAQVTPNVGQQKRIVPSDKMKLQMNTHFFKRFTDVNKQRWIKCLWCDQYIIKADVN